MTQHQLGRDLSRETDHFFEGQPWLDPLANRLQKGIHGAFDALGSAGPAVENTLHGQFLGHPLHPLLVGVPIGAWSAVSALDLLDALGVNGLDTATDWLLGIGLLGAGASVAAGWADWSKTGGLSRRVGLTHGLLNEVAQAIYLGSLLARLRGHKKLGKALALGGLGLLSVTGYLGGHLVYHRGVGVGQPFKAG